MKKETLDENIFERIAAMSGAAMNDEEPDKPYNPELFESDASGLQRMGLAYVAKRPAFEPGQIVIYRAELGTPVYKFPLLGEPAVVIRYESGRRYRAEPGTPLSDTPDDLLIGLVRRGSFLIIWVDAARFELAAQPAGHEGGDAPGHRGLERH